jgi:pimeloyl-ACP methyl ester carboxylesterase
MAGKRDFRVDPDVRAEIPRARLLRLEGAGHGIARVDCGEIARAALERTR